MYPLDQVTESLITSIWPEDSPAQSFAYTQFFTALEQTVEELTKCFLLEFRIKPGPVLWPLPGEALVYRPL